MKKIKLIFFSTIIIAFTSAFFSLAAEVKDAPAPTSSVSTKVVPAVTKAAIPTPTSPVPAMNAPVASPTQPAHGAIKAPVPSQTPPATTVINVPVANQTTTTVVTNAPVPSPTQPVVTPSSRDSYSYNPSGKPDPFLPFIKIETAKEKKEKAEKKEPLSIFPLQRAETTAYRVVGIVGNEDRRVAIAQDAAKKFYPLLIGTRIGLNNGKVVEILADRVIVEEYENKKETRVILKLRKN